MLFASRGILPGAFDLGASMGKPPTARELRKLREYRKAQARSIAERSRERRRRQVGRRRAITQLLYLVAMVVGLVLVWWWLITR